MADPAPGPQRSRLSSAAGGKAEREKRKRSRVTPEQLVHLEQFFAMDRSPTAARRKEISDMLGMQERQTQIWFQNRRAKAKLQDGKKGRGSSAETPPDTPPELATGYEAELHSLLNEDEPVTIIPCTDLSVGTWRRIATTLRKHDLVAYLCDTKRCLTWFIHSFGYGFKMEIPFDIIVDIQFTNAAPGSGLASFFLSRPPTFYLESISPVDPGRITEPVRHWKKCADWTEDQQATKVLRHNLVGSAVQLAHVIRHLNEHTSGSDIQLHSPSYHSKTSLPALELQPPPLAGFAATGYHCPQDGMELRQRSHQILTHKRSISSPVPDQQLPLRDEPVHLPSAPLLSSVIPEPDPSMYPQYPGHPSLETGQSTTYSNYSVPAVLHPVSHSSLSASRESCQSFSSHGLHPRPYSAGSGYPLSSEDDSGILSLPDGLHLPRSSGPSRPTPYETPSPPLLTTPFYPPGPALGRRPTNPQAYDPAVSITLAMPGMSNSATDP